MAKRTAYEDLVLIPSIVADTVATTIYDGSELSMRIRDGSQVAKTEALRLQMTTDQRREFVQLVDALCRRAYETKIDWFMKCLKLRNGRDQLYMWVRHWLASYLGNPAALRKMAS